MDSRSSVYLRLAVVGLVLILAGCDEIEIPLPATVPSPSVPTPELDEAPPTSPPATIESPPPISAAPLQVFPLVADLYYLDDEGQVWHQPQSGDERAAQVVSRPDRVVYDFAVAPGGDWILYRTDEFIATQSIDGLSGQLVAEGTGTPLDVTHGDTLVWSSDASKIAYTTKEGFQVYIPGAGEFGTAQIYDAPEGQIAHLAWSPDALWLAVVRAEGTAALYRVDPSPQLHVELGGVNGLTWLADGRLAFAPVEGGLAVVPPDSLAERAFLVPQPATVTLPIQRPDGILTFLLHPEGPDTPGYLGTATDEGYQQASEVPIDAVGLSWTPDGTYLLSLGGGQVAALIDPLSGASDEFETGGPAIDADWGLLLPDSVAGMSLPSALYFLAPMDGVFQVWKLPADKSPPNPVTTSTADVLGYDITRGGARLAYATGEGVYVAQPGGEQPTLIAEAQPETLGGPGGPDFSPDGEQLAYDNAGLWVVDLATGAPRQIVADVIPTSPETELDVTLYREPQWSPDGAWLLASIGYYEGSGWALFTPEGDGPYTLQQFGFHARWTDDGRVLVFSEGGGYAPPGLSLAVPGEQPVISQPLDVPVIDARLGPDGELRFLGDPSPFGLGPIVPRLYTANPDGSQIQVASEPLKIVQPVLSPDGRMAAGVVNATYVDGRPTKRLVIVDLETGETFAIEGVEDPHALAWDE